MALPSLYRGPEEYLQELIESIRANGSRITDFNEGSGARSLYESFSLSLSQQTLVLQQVRDDFYLATATGAALDLKAADYQVPRKGAFPASGVVRISRPAPGAAVSIPAGFGSLQTIPAPGQVPTQFVTTEDAVFGGTDLSIDVPAMAVQGGVAGNIANGTQLLPINPVLGFSTESGFVAQGDFAGGVDVESDDAFRARIPIAVQGRVKGTEAAYLAAALGVTGVESANVLEAGDTKAGGGTVAAGAVEVYYEGAASLLTEVDSAAKAARVLDANVSAFVATAVRALVSCTVYVYAGSDAVAVAAAVTEALRGVVNSTPIGGTARYSEAIRAVDQLPQLISVGVPFADFRKFADPGGTDADIVMDTNTYPTLAAADVTVAVVEL